MKVLNPTLDEEAISKAAKLIRAGEVVAIPTETVYGLAADGLNGEACHRIFAAKNRPADNPLILHIAKLEDLGRLTPVPELGEALFPLWPGPLTLIFPKSEIIPDCVTAGGETVAIRMPTHPIARAVIEATGSPLAAPSANLSGKPSPTNAEDVIEDMDGRIAAVLDGGACTIGVESTVVDLTSKPAKILRPGYYTEEDLRAYIPHITTDAALLKDREIPKSPGQKYRHYAPRAEVEVYMGKREHVHEAMRRRLQEDVLTGVLVFDDSMEYFPEPKIGMGPREDIHVMGERLFSALRAMDRRGADRILIEFRREKGFGETLYNRLMKASSGKMIDV